MFGAQKYAIQIDRLLAAPIVQAHLGNRAGNRDARIVHQHMQLAIILADRGDDRGPDLFAGHILFHKARVAACVFDCAHTIFAAIALHIGDDQLCALPRQKDCTFAANPAGPARYQCHFA